MALLGDHELNTGSIVMHPRCFYELSEIGHDDWQETHYSPNIDASYNQSVKTNHNDNPPVYAYFKNIPVYVTTMCSKGCVYVLANPSLVGMMPIEKSTTVVSQDECFKNKDKHIYCIEPKLNRESFIGYVKLGVSVVNDYATTKILYNQSHIPYNTKKLRKVIKK
jgi:hypothetical protein